MAVVAVSLLYGCVGERHQMTPEEQKAFLADQNEQHTAELKSVEAQAKAQGLTVGSYRNSRSSKRLMLSWSAHRLSMISKLITSA